MLFYEFYFLKGWLLNLVNFLKRTPCSDNQTSKTEAKTEDAGTTSVLRHLLNSNGNGKPATVPLTETTIKTENVPQSDEATLTKQDRAVKTEIPFKR